MPPIPMLRTFEREPQSQCKLVDMRELDKRGSGEGQHSTVAKPTHQRHSRPQASKIMEAALHPVRIVGPDGF